MKNIFTTLVTIGIVTTSVSQSKINFNIASLSKGKLVVSYFENNFEFHVDTLLVSDHKTSLSLADISQVFLVFPKTILEEDGKLIYKFSGVTPVFLGGSNIQVKIGSDYALTVTNNPEQNTFAAFYKSFRETEDSSAKMNLLKATVKANTARQLSIYSTDQLMDNIEDENIKATVGDSMVKYLTPALLNTARGKSLKEKINIYHNTAIGRPAPVFHLKDTSGKAVSLSDYKGRYVLLEFWARNCAPCRKMNPKLKELYEKYKDKNVVFINVSTDFRREDWTKAITDDGLPWVQVSELKSGAPQAQKLYGVTAIPRNFLINPEGKIENKDLSVKQIDNFFSARLQ